MTTTEPALKSFESFFFEFRVSFFSSLALSFFPFCSPSPSLFLDSPHFRAGPDRHGPQHAHPCAQQRPVADVRVSGSPASARAPQGNVMQQRDAVADDGRLADDDARRVVYHHAPADPGARMDVDVEDLGDAGLDREGKGAAACFDVRRRRRGVGGGGGGREVSFFSKSPRSFLSLVSSSSKPKTNSPRSHR